MVSPPTCGGEAGGPEGAEAGGGGTASDTVAVPIVDINIIVGGAGPGTS
jgi:hypothetical protein